MQNVVSLRSDRPRRQRIVVGRGAAQILFFTGVRYCRDDDFETHGERCGHAVVQPSGRPLDAAAR